MKPSQLLRQARALIEDEFHWWDGQRHRRFFPQAQLCSIEALRQAFRAASEPSGNAICAAGGHLVKAIGIEGVNTIPQFNDSHSHAEVMAMWQRAIDLAEVAEMYAELGPESVEEAVLA